MGVVKRDPEKSITAASTQRRIVVSSGVGEGPTPLAAFDAALASTGLANYNLIPLSSVIPPGSSLERENFMADEEEYGHRLYVVIARQDENRPGLKAWAGLGWIQEPETGRGLFVELHGHKQAEVARSITDTLEAMRAARDIPYGAVQQELVGIACRGRPVCAIVAAVYQSEGWE